MPRSLARPLSGTVLAISLSSLAAQDPVPKGKPVVVTATRTEKEAFDLPFSTSTIRSFDVTTRRQSRTMPEALKETPGISVQKTSHGQGSPKFRGQTGFQTLLLVDGIRLNDSTWRSGNVEYWNHVDPYSFDRFEVVRGPSSVLWGSDAVSGVGHAFQKGRTTFDEGFHVDVGSVVRYSSAEDSWVLRAESQGNVDDFGWHVGLSFKDFGDVTAGRDIGLQPYTNYDEVDGDAKLTFRIDDHQRISYGLQVVHLEDVPRTHSTIRARTGWRGTTAGSDIQREHSHRRQLHYLQYAVTEGAFFDSFTTSLAYKNRYEQENRIPSNRRRQIAASTVETLGLVTQFDTQIGDGTLTYGGDFYRDWIDSDFREFEVDGSIRRTQNRGVVAGDATYDMLGLFAQYDVDVATDWNVLLGARYSHVRMDARRVDVPGDSVVFDDVKDDWNALTGSVRLMHRTTEQVRLFAGASQGFRAPNLSDTTRFDVGRSGEQEVPATGLKAEKYLTFELGARFDDGTFAAGVTGYYTDVRDQINRSRTGATIGGLPEVTKSNVGDGWFAGFEAEASYNLAALELDEWEVYGFVDYVDGRIDQRNNAGLVVRDRPGAIPPPTGMIGLRWTEPSETAGAEVYTRLAYHVHNSRYTESDATNPQRIPPDGLPGYALVGLRGWKQLNRFATLSVAVENLGDIDHKLMDSGSFEPGTNVIVTLEAKF
jgi:hemoglobin/transferrin/lactoferrin receptor protein